MSFSEIRQLKDTPVETVTVGGRRGQIATIVDTETLPSGGMRVVVQGFLRKRLVSMISDVSIDGFYKYQDEKIAPLPEEDMMEFD